MDVVILCGGRGVRLGLITKKTPKPLIKVGTEPILKHILDQIDNKKIKNVFICTGYKSVKIEKYLAGMTFKYIKPVISKGHWSWETGKRILNLKKKLKNNFLILYGDNYVDFSFSNYLNNLHKRNSKFSLLVQNAKLCDDGYGNVDVYDKKNIKLYNNVRNKNHYYSDLGYIKATREIFKYFNKNKNEPLPNILNKLSLNENVNCFITKSKFITITNAKKLKLANNFFSN